MTPEQIKRHRRRVDMLLVCFMLAAMGLGVAITVLVLMAVGAVPA